MYKPIAYRVGQELSYIIEVLWITPRATEPSTVSVFPSSVKCGRLSTAQTCAHSGIEPSRLAEGFPQGGPKSSKKFANFWPFRNFTSLYLCNRYKQRHISRYGKMRYPSPIQLSHVYGPIAHGVLQGGPKSKWRNTGFRDYEPSIPFLFSWASSSVVAYVGHRPTHILG